MGILHNGRKPDAAMPRAMKKAFRVAKRVLSAGRKVLWLITTASDVTRRRNTNNSVPAAA